MGDLEYAEERARLNPINNLGAALISALVLAATWGNWVGFTIVAVTQAVLIPFNALVNKVLLSRLGARRGELLRTLVNVTGGVCSYHFAGWPFPVWFWLPFNALASDQQDRRLANAILIAFCAVQDLVALADGVHWLYPVAFTTGAVFCARVMAIRYGIIRSMLLRSDEQRRGLERANAEIQAAHEKLTAETKARLQAEAELMQAQKLEAVGRLAAGIAHEINTPVQFVGDSIHFLRDASNDLFTVLDKHRDAAPPRKTSTCPT
jgi:signal transduction histidine kinase